MEVESMTIKKFQDIIDYLLEKLELYVNEEIYDHNNQNVNVNNYIKEIEKMKYEINILDTWLDDYKEKVIENIEIGECKK